MGGPGLSRGLGVLLFVHTDWPSHMRLNNLERDIKLKKKRFFKSHFTSLFQKNSLEDSREDGVPFDQMMAIQMRNEDLESSLRLQQFHQQYVILDQANRIPNLPPWQE